MKFTTGARLGGGQDLINILCIIFERKKYYSNNCEMALQLAYIYFSIYSAKGPLKR